MKKFAFIMYNLRSRNIFLDIYTAADALDAVFKCTEYANKYDVVMLTFCKVPDSADEDKIRKHTANQRKSLNEAIKEFRKGGNLDVINAAEDMPTHIPQETIDFITSRFETVV